MIFIYEGTQYRGETAAEVVRQMARAAAGAAALSSPGIREYLDRAAERFSDRIPLRELDFSSHVSDELLAFNYLCLLDEYELGVLRLESPEAGEK